VNSSSYPISELFKRAKQMMACRAVLLTALAATSFAQEHPFTAGNTRVTALSETLLRIEPKGPRGPEDGGTFVAAARPSFTGVPVFKLNS
jgi:hypothetical protein